VRAYEHRHVVAFEETNLVGNVYFVNYLRWQGHCRELFLRDRAPEVLDELRQDLLLVTTRCSCEYLVELSAFDEVRVRMRLREMRQNRLALEFDYFRHTAAGDELVARGEQQVACMRRTADGVVPTPVPPPLVRALEPYSPGLADVGARTAMRTTQ
jgi:enediyne core biosynthesis thioesterase